jgi:AraC-like DNA-binding protein
VEATLSNAFGLQDTIINAPQARQSEVCAITRDEAPNPTELPKIDEVPSTLKERLALARVRLRYAAEHGLRIRVYEVALDLDMSEFHFARQFRSAYGCSPHVYYDEVRAARARDFLDTGLSQGQAARRIGLRRPAELRALLAKRTCCPTMADVDGFAASNA